MPGWNSNRPRVNGPQMKSIAVTTNEIKPAPEVTRAGGKIMKVAKNVKVGDVIQFPRTQFAPLRSGWNGWLFSAGIVEKLYISSLVALLQNLRLINIVVNLCQLSFKTFWCTGYKTRLQTLQLFHIWKVFRVLLYPGNVS